MTHGFEQPAAPTFDAEFFANLGQEMEDISLQTAAQDALAGILTIKHADGQEKSFQQIKDEAETFFANPLVADDMRLIESLSMQYADFCASHGLDGSSSMNEGSLGKVYEQGTRHDDGHDHGNDGHHGSLGRAKSKGKKKKPPHERPNKHTPRSFNEWFAKYFKQKTVMR